MTETQTKFITVTTKDVGSNGVPKVIAINIAHIVVVEPVLWKIHSIDIEGADEVIIEGTNITVAVNVNHIIQVESRDPFDHVLKRIELADGIVQQTGDAPEVPLGKPPLVVVDCCCGQQINTTEPYVELQPDGRIWHGNAAGGGHVYNAILFGPSE